MPGNEARPSEGGKKVKKAVPTDFLFPRLDHDAIKWNRIMISSLCLSMIFSENRFPLFRIML
jgi:hypothetical protein